MTTHASTVEDHESTAPPTPRPTRAYLLVIGIGLVFGAFTMLSGIVPLLTKWEDHDSVSREVFGGIPGPLKLAFYTIIPVLIVYGGFVFAQRVKNWQRGGPDTRSLTPR